MQIIHKLLTGILFWATYFLPIYSFEQTFRLLEITSQDVWGIYRDGIIVFSILAIFSTPLFVWLSSKFFSHFWCKIIIIIWYLFFYYSACVSIAWDYRSIFGATWLPSEIFPALVSPRWYFYLFAAIGLFFHYQCLGLLQRKVLKNK